MIFSWIEFYKDFSQKLLKYKNDRTPLVNWIYSNLQGYINHFKDDSDGRRVPDTDPFTVFAIINRGITYDKKKDICTRFKSFLNISAPIPEDFTGIPEMNNQKSNFMAFEERRKEGDIQRLWNVFEDAVLDKDIEKSYNSLSNQFLISKNLTIGLFWIRPDKYLALDGNNNALLKSIGIVNIKPGFVQYKEYQNIMEQLNSKIQSREINCTNYAEFSNLAYKQNNHTSNRDLPKNTSRKYWTYSPGANASKWELCIKEQIICIGWDELGNLSEYSTRKEMLEAIKKHYSSEGSAKNDSLAVWQFTKEMKPGDIIFAKKGRNTIIGRGVVESDYEFDTYRKDFKHIRKVKWTDTGEWFTDDKTAMKTLTDITRYTDFVAHLNNIVDDIYKGVSEQGGAYGNDDVEYWWLNANPKYWKVDTFNVGETQEYTAYNEKGNKRQLFKYFKAVKPGDMLVCYETTPTKKVKAICKITKGLHEDDGYEVINFVIKEKVAYQVSWNELISNEIFRGSEPYRAATGSLYHLTKTEYDAITNLACGEKKTEKYTKSDFLKEVFISADDYDKLQNLLLKKKNLILQGAPGVGKTFAAKRLAYAMMGEKDEDRVMQVQFHQNYNYEDFVMGYKPNDKGGFELEDGIFYRFCKRAANDREKKYFFIIDEINRGNLSKIFGELLMLIENNYRDKSIQLAYKKNEEFAVPSNLYIIGMMNTADRSLAMIDYALRRRFSFFEMKPGFESPVFKDEISKKNDYQLEELVEAIKELNRVIEKDDSLGSGFCIGHSYLCNLNNDYDLENIVEYDIIPMLREYWFDNDNLFDQETQKLRNALK